MNRDERDPDQGTEGVVLPTPAGATSQRGTGGNGGGGGHDADDDFIVIRAPLGASSQGGGQEMILHLPQRPPSTLPLLRDAPRMPGTIRDLVLLVAPEVRAVVLAHGYEAPRLTGQTARGGTFVDDANPVELLVDIQPSGRVPRELDALTHALSVMLSRPVVVRASSDLARASVARLERDALLL